MSAERYQVVLYNSDALKGIHPVSDKAFFEKTLGRVEKCRLVNSISLNKWDENKCKAARFGYKNSDKAHVYYQLANGVSGFMTYFYGFTPNKSLESKVDSDETNSELSN